MSDNTDSLTRNGWSTSDDLREKNKSIASEPSSKKMVVKTGLTDVNPLLNTPKKKRNQCQGCGKSGVPMEMDHTAPKSKGGRGTVPICRGCNRTKGAKDNFDFKESIEMDNGKITFRSEGELNWNNLITPP